MRVFLCNTTDGFEPGWAWWKPPEPTEEPASLRIKIIIKREIEKDTHQTIPIRTVFIFSRNTRTYKHSTIQIKIAQDQDSTLFDLSLYNYARCKISV
jgi:hypothetical protein